MTYADSAPRALGRSRNRQQAAAPSLQHALVLATDLQVGDHIRDRGDLHTITTIDPDPYPVRGSLTVTMDDGAHLTIPAHQHVTVWE